MKNNYIHSTQIFDAAAYIETRYKFGCELRLVMQKQITMSPDVTRLVHAYII